MRPWTLGLSVFGVLAYAVVSHGLMTRAAAWPWGVAVLLGPPALALAVHAWRSRRWVVLALVGTASCALAAAVARGDVAGVNLAYLVEHAGLHAALGTAFAVSVRGNVSLVGRLAARVHALTPPMQAYTRHVTQAWALYFYAMAAASIAVWAAGSFERWSLFANFGTPLGLAAMFAGEHLLRYRLHPEFERASLRDVVHAWRRPHACESARP
jgi:uncharacterized membrane protein